MKPLKYYFHKLLNKNKTLANEIIKTKSISESFEYLSGRLSQNERLFFLRFGDGEFVTMLKKDHKNYVYNNKLDEELEKSFRIKDPNFLIACPINYPYDEFHAKGIYKQFNWQEDMINLIEEKNIQTKEVYENPCIFHCMAVFKPKKFKTFLNTHVRPKTKMFVGSTDKELAEKLYGKIDYYVQIPPKHAYESINEWWPKIKNDIDKVDLIIPSAGSASNAIALRLWNLNINVKLLDIGSIIDAAAEKETRTWIRLRGHKVLSLLEPKPKISFNKKIKFILKDIKFYFRNQVI